MVDRQDRPKPLRLRSLWQVVRAAGLMPWTFMFVALFVAATIVVSLSEPGINKPIDAVWLLFQVVTTIGLGDFTCVTIAGRIAAVVLSLYSVLYLALITGAMVSFCTERMQARRDASIAHFLAQLEHLPELSHEELVALSNKIKRL